MNHHSFSLRIIITFIEFKHFEFERAWTDEFYWHYEGSTDEAKENLRLWLEERLGKKEHIHNWEIDACDSDKEFVWQDTQDFLKKHVQR